MGTTGGCLTTEAWASHGVLLFLVKADLVIRGLISRLIWQHSVEIDLLQVAAFRM